MLCNVSERVVSGHVNQYFFLPHARKHAKHRKTMGIVLEEGNIDYGWENRLIENNAIGCSEFSP